MKTEIKSMIWGLLFLCMYNFAIANDDILNERAADLISHIENCYISANEYHSKVSQRALEIEGMSGLKFRHFLNCLCELPDTVYFEIGTWKGSTLVAALYANTPSILEAVAIDNWSQFGWVRHNFFSNIATHIPSLPLKFYEENCFAIDRKKLFHRPVTIYFYDGDHTEAVHEKAFTYFDDIFDDVFIAIVDDWNWDFVRKGTLTAFEKLGYDVVYQLVPEMETTEPEPGTWWNGCLIAVIKKNRNVD